MDINTINNITSESQAMLQAVINEATENAVKFIKKEEREKLNKKYDFRLHNTTLLLINYKNLKEHSENAVYSEGQLINNKVETDLDQDEDRDDIYINAILKSKKRTEIMLEQIDRSLEYYELKCLNTKKEDIQRRIKVIKLLYITGKNIQEVADELYIDERTVSRTRKAAIKEIAPLLFGIDGINLS